MSFDCRPAIGDGEGRWEEEEVDGEEVVSPEGSTGNPMLLAGELTGPMKSR